MAEAYEPDEQDEIVGDAMALGGPAFVERLYDQATDAAETAVPWSGAGPEPAGYREAWLAAARQTLAARRVELGLEP